MAEHYRLSTIAQLINLQIFAGAMEEALRALPDDDAAFEHWATQLMATVPAAGHFLEMFRISRECHGGRQ